MLGSAKKNAISNKAKPFQDAIGAKVGEREYLVARRTTNIAV